jgi:hypothetical protein
MQTDYPQLVSIKSPYPLSAFLHSWYKMYLTIAIVLAHQDNSLQVNLSLLLDHIILFQSQPV